MQILSVSGAEQCNELIIFDSPLTERSADEWDNSEQRIGTLFSRLSVNKNEIPQSLTGKESWIPFY